MLASWWITKDLLCDPVDPVVGAAEGDNNLAIAGVLGHETSYIGGWAPSKKKIAAVSVLKHCAAIDVG